MFAMCLHRTISWLTPCPMYRMIVTMITFQPSELLACVVLIHLIFLFTGTRELQRMVQRLKWAAVKPSTRSSYQRHWRCYIRFCRLYNFSPLPCSVSQASYYIAFLGLFMKYSSIVSYYQAVCFGHKLLGLQAPPMSNPVLRPVFLGLLNSPNNCTVSKDSLSSTDLRKLVNV